VPRAAAAGAPAQAVIQVTDNNEQTMTTNRTRRTLPPPVEYDIPDGRITLTTAAENQASPREPSLAITRS
jgi:hypothetical protein